MISKQVMQNTIEGISAIAHVELRILDMEAKTVAAVSSSEAVFTEEESREIAGFAASPGDALEIRDRHLFKIYNEDQPEFILSVRGSQDDVHMIGKMAAFQISTLLVAYRERFDRDNFIKNLLLDNLLLVDIYSRAKKLHIAEDARRVCLVLRTQKDREAGTMETVRTIVGESDDFVTEVDETDIILVHEIKDGESGDSEALANRLRSYAEELYEKLTESGLEGLRIAYGTSSRDIKDVSRSYKEAKMSLDVSRIFYENARIVCYSELGIGRLIYQLPLPLCRMFLSETFGTCKPEEIDDEIEETVDVFFENSLNVSETSRQLFIHRNTLVYRLDKLQKITGLDVRVFEDAMTYRIAMMVVRYMKYMEEPNY